MHDDSLDVEINRKIPLWGLPLEVSAYILLPTILAKSIQRGRTVCDSFSCNSIFVRI